MKVILIGKKNHLRWVEQLNDGFNKSNINSEIVYTNEFTLFERIMIFLRIKNRNSILLEKINKLNSDLIFCVSPHFLSDKFSQMIKNNFLDKLKFCWIGDKISEDYNDEIINKLSPYDIAYITDFGVLDFINSNNIHKNTIYLPLAANDTLFSKTNTTKRDNYLLFIASPSSERANILKNIKNIKIKIIGKKWLDYLTADENITILNKNISREELVKEYNNAKYILNIKDSRNCISGINQRFFEGYLCGAFVLQDYVDDLKLCFENEIVTYNSVEEINSIIKIMDQNDETYIQNIETTRNEILKKHLFIHRVSSIVDNFNELKNSRF